MVVRWHSYKRHAGEYPLGAAAKVKHGKQTQWALEAVPREFSSSAATGQTAEWRS